MKASNCVSLSSLSSSPSSVSVDFVLQGYLVILTICFSALIHARFAFSKLTMENPPLASAWRTSHLLTLGFERPDNDSARLMQPSNSSSYCSARNRHQIRADHRMGP